MNDWLFFFFRWERIESGENYEEERTLQLGFERHITIQSGEKSFQQKN